MGQPAAGSASWPCPAGAGPLRGFFGKLPSRGDFVGNGLPRAFLAPWEAWVAEAVTASRALLGDAWLAAWMEAPVWRFVLPGGACGPDAALGLVLPSVDRVGRTFPLVLAALFPGRREAPAPECGTAFLDAAEAAAREAIADDLTPAELTARLAAAAAPVAGAAAGEAALWWTEGAPTVPAQRLQTAGLPSMPAHAALLVGSGPARGGVA
jgi:type VI secretion system protein ImpM